MKAENRHFSASIIQLLLCNHGHISVGGIGSLGLLWLEPWMF